MLEKQALEGKKMLMMVTIFSILLLALFVSASSDPSESGNSHKTVQQSPPKMDPRLSSKITLHAFLLWASLGFLMPVGVLIIRLSNKIECSKKLEVLFYSHVILQITSVLLALTGAVLSFFDFENTFNNMHQKLGLALYGVILVQPFTGCCCRPRRGVKSRSIWYFIHWLLGTGVCSLGIINIYLGLHAYHTKNSSGIKIWACTMLFTAEICIIIFIYLLQDRWDYLQKYGEVLHQGQNRTSDHAYTSDQKDATMLP